jgi:hypothetical protein
MFTVARICLNCWLVSYITCGSIKIMSIEHIRLYFRVVKWFINNYLIMIWKENLALRFEVHEDSFIQGLWKYDRKPNHYFTRIHWIENYEYFLCLTSFFVSNNSAAIQPIVVQWCVCVCMYAGVRFSLKSYQKIEVILKSDKYLV